MKANVLTDSLFYKGFSGISRYANEVSVRFCRTNLTYIPSSGGGPLATSLRPISLRTSSFGLGGNLFWSPGFVPFVKKKIVQHITVHDLNHLFAYSKLHLMYIRLVLFPLWRKVDTIFTVSEFTRNLIIDELGESVKDKVIVAYNGVSSSFSQKRDLSNKRRYLIYVGNRRSYKNINRMITAFAIVAKELDIELLVTGVEDLRLLNIVANYGLKNRLHFIGSPSESELAALYSNSLGCIFVSLHEGFGFPPVEAMSCGSPAIVSNTSSMPEISGPFARYVNPLDIESIQDGIRDVVSNSEKWRQKVAGAALWLKRYSWDKTAQVIEDKISGSPHYME